MTGDYKSRFLPGILFLTFTLLLLSGCIAENTDDCSTAVPLKISLPADVSPETVKDMTLYVFDDKNLLLDIRPMGTAESIMLDYPDIPVLHCVALGNVQDGTMLVGPLEKGNPRSGGSISLKPLLPTKAETNSIYYPPADLFYGELEIENKTITYHRAEERIQLFRRSASMNIILRGLQRLTGTEDTDYSLVVGETCSRMDFNGKYEGPLASYSPPVNLSDNGDFLTRDFRLLPVAQNGGVTIDIYHRNALLKSIALDNSGLPFVPIVGKTTNVLLDFRGSVDVEIEITGWGETYVWKEWN